MSSLRLEIEVIIPDEDDAKELYSLESDENLSTPEWKRKTDKCIQKILSSIKVISTADVRDWELFL